MTTSAYILCVGAEIRDRFAPPLTDPKTRSKVPYDHALEGLRGLAALWVAYAHVWVALTIGLSWGLKLKLQPVLKRWFQQSILDRIYAT